MSVTFDDVRKAAHRLPGVEDSTSYGTPALKVRGKLFARLHQGGECFVLRTTILDRQIMMQANPDAFFLTDHYVGYPWILVRLSATKKGHLPALIEMAWRLVAPKSLLQEYECSTTSSPESATSKRARRSTSRRSNRPA